MKCNMNLDRLALILIIINILTKISADDTTATIPEYIKSENRIFSPRVDYNEWMPVGRGDPLKQDPTYDYSPPVLDRVKYWVDPKEKPKTDVLLLGVSSMTKIPKKDSKYHINRRNYYSSLPTRLMPPPIISSAENYRWPPRKGNFIDSISEGSNEYVSVVRPSPNMIATSSHNYGYSTRPYYKDPHTYEQDFLTSMESQMHYTGRKPFLHTLLQKETIHHIPQNSQIPQHASTMMMHHPIQMYSSPIPPSSTPSPTPSMSSNYYSTNSFVIMPSVEVTTASPFYSPTIPPIHMSTGPTPSHFIPTAPPKQTSILSTTSPQMTTDSLFSHYKQPDQPISGPMYLIIEGHSKVKTYGLHSPNEIIPKQEPKIVLISDNNDPVVHHVVSEDENGHIAEVKHLHMKQEPLKKPTPEKDPPSAMHSLLSLLDSSFGSFLETNNSNKEKSEDINLLKGNLDKNKTIRSKRSSHENYENKDDIKEISIESNYFVKKSEGKINEFYKKGIVVDEKHI